MTDFLIHTEDTERCEDRKKDRDLKKISRNKAKKRDRKKLNKSKTLTI
jgi:hypothetical protein